MDDLKQLLTCLHWDTSPDKLQEAKIGLSTLNQTAFLRDNLL